MRETSTVVRLGRGQRLALGGAVALAVGLAGYGAVAANVTAGWPDPVAVGLHAAAPLMLLAMVEAGRAVLLRRVGLAAGTVREGIPCGRWVLSPWRTWLLWRRMVLWQITSYDAALEVEARLRRARALLVMRYGRRWRRETPADLVWMLRSGLFVEEAFMRVDALLLKDCHDAPSPAVDEDANAQRGVVGGETGAVDGTEYQLQEVVRINERHWARCGRPVSAETVRKHLRIGAARARALTYAARAADIAAVTRGAVASAWHCVPTEQSGAGATTTPANSASASPARTAPTAHRPQRLASVRFPG